MARSASSCNVVRRGYGGKLFNYAFTRGRATFYEAFTSFCLRIGCKLIQSCPCLDTAFGRSVWTEKLHWQAVDYRFRYSRLPC